MAKFAGRHGDDSTDKTCDMHPNPDIYSDIFLANFLSYLRRTCLIYLHTEEVRDDPETPRGRSRSQGTGEAIRSRSADTKSIKTSRDPHTWESWEMQTLADQVLCSLKVWLLAPELGSVWPRSKLRTSQWFIPWICPASAINSMRELNIPWRHRLRFVLKVKIKHIIRSGWCLSCSFLHSSKKHLAIGVNEFGRRAASNVECFAHLTAIALMHGEHHCNRIKSQGSALLVAARKIRMDWHIGTLSVRWFLPTCSVYK